MIYCEGKDVNRYNKKDSVLVTDLGFSYKTLSSYSKSKHIL